MKDLRAIEFLEKAEKYLAWCENSLVELEKYGLDRNTDQIERTFVSVISHIGSLHQALVDSGKKLGQGKWRDELNSMRAKDPLLKYLWKARDSEVHDAVEKWKFNAQSLKFRVKDPKKFEIAKGSGGPLKEEDILRLNYVIFGAKNDQDLLEKMRNNQLMPNAELAHAGIEVISNITSLALHDFEINRSRKVEVMRSPTEHRGNKIMPGAVEAIRLAIKFYREKYFELKGFLGEK